MDTRELQAALRAFGAARGWLDFHNPKNLAMALSVEAAEVVELFQWLTPEQARALADDPAGRQRIGEEVADVLMYLLRLADVCGVDLQAAVTDKLARNALKYPAPGS
ncbi:MAG: hypothetical protein RLY78_1004 [Pseudomonadota bacterium]|jgi:NTP pyrophosphatase (non-canonical NTP hydrolase)|uniref:Nucleotide pyrophosphohydrolase n=1 Tax=Pseudaquabacterium rugosum TaxID=2984194 RepID=A0ABU9B943_9BURK